MKKRLRLMAVGLTLLLLTGFAVTRPSGIQLRDVIVAFMLVFWVGLPLLFFGAIAWGPARAWLASLRRPAPVIRVPDTDLMA